MTGGLGPTPERRNPSALPDYDDDLSPLLELSAQVRETLARIVPARQRAQQQIKTLAQRQEEFEYDAREACDLGDDDLARQLLAKKQYLTNLIAELTSQQHSLEDEEREFTQMQQRLQVRYEILRNTPLPPDVLDALESNAPAAPESKPPAAPEPNAPPGERHPRSIPQDVKIKVSARDGAKCRLCGSTKDLHFDHVIPWSKGGTNTVNEHPASMWAMQPAQGRR